MVKSQSHGICHNHPPLVRQSIYSNKRENEIITEAIKLKTAYLNMLVTSIPTNIKFTGNQTLINLHVSGSVETKPRRLNT